MRRGSVTVFLALTMTCMFSAVFALLEVARVYGMKANVQMCTLQAKDGWLASYQSELWKDYHLLFWEGAREDFPSLSQAGNLQQELVESNWEQVNGFRSNYYVLAVHMSNVAVTEYQLATDDGGLPFCRQAVDTMKNSVAETAVQTLLGVLEGQKESEESAVQNREEQAMDALEQAQKNKASREASGDGSSENGTDASGFASQSESTGEKVLMNGKEVDEENNPIQWMKDVRKNGVYSLLMPEQSMSDKTVDLSDSLEKRNLQTGNMASEEKLGAEEKVLFRLYLAQNFQSLRDKKGDRALDYEMEYMIGGKKSDKDNMKAVINRLLLMREAVNLAYLETDPEKQEMAVAMATAIAAATGLPVLEPVFQQGVLAAWALAESISDVKTLLNGGKVSLVKTGNQWQTSLTNLGSADGASGGTTSSGGLTYSGYLQILLWTMKDSTLATRAMDLIEWTEDVKMDQMVSKMTCEYAYEAPRLFWNFVSLGNHSMDSYRFQDQAEMNYRAHESSENDATE